MITSRSYIKMLQASEEEREKMIDKLSEEDAKSFLKIFMKTIKKEHSRVSLADSL